MRKLKYFACAAVLLTAAAAQSAMAADLQVKEASFRREGEIVHTLSDGNIECVIEALGAGDNALMLNAVYENGTDKLISLSYVTAENGIFSNTVNVADAKNKYITMCVWDGLESANAKTQVYKIAPSDPAPENPWGITLNNNGVIAFEWNDSEDNLKTAGYRIYKNGEQAADITKTVYNDNNAHWYSSSNSYKLTAYDEYGNESDGVSFNDVAVDNSNMAAILFSQPNITEKMSLYIATGKETDDTWYGYNTAQTIDGVQCRDIPADRRAVFKYSSDFKSRIGSDVRDAVIRVTYYDDNTDAFKISYVGKGARYTNINIDKTDTKTWITKELKVSDFTAAYIDPREGAKTQDESVDFSIWSKADSDKGDVVDTDTYISELQIILEGSLPEPEPTLEPGQTPAPTAEPTPEPTPEPTLNPADIKKASVKFLTGQTPDTSSESDHNLMRIYWGGNNNMINDTGWYGYTAGALKDGEESREILGGKRLVLVYDDALNQAIGAAAREATLRIKYYDSGSDRIRVSYIGKTERYRTVTIQKTNTNTWKWAEIDVTDLVNSSDDGSGLQDAQTNLSIWSRASGENETSNTTDYISEIELVLDKSTSEPETPPTAVPTFAPGQTPTVQPTSAPTVSPTPVPAIDPSDIKKASITFLKGQTPDTCSQSENDLITMYWGKNDAQIGSGGWYGYNSGTEKDGVECREIGDNKRMVLMFSDALNEAIGDTARDAVIRVSYYDSGSDKIRVSYIGASARYKTVTIQKTGTNTWKTAEFAVSDFINKSNDGSGLQDEQTYFSIWSRASGENESNNTPDYISAVELALDGGEAVPTAKPEAEATPTAKPTEKPEATAAPSATPAIPPTATPSASPTEEPASTPKPTDIPNEITSAYIDFLDGQTIDTCAASNNDLIRIFWAGKNNDDQINKDGWYGYNTGAVMNEENCRAVADGKRLVLSYDGALNNAIGNEPRSAVIRVRYLDNGTDKIRVSYISQKNRYQDLNIQKEDSGEWKWAEFSVTDLVKESSQKNDKGNGYQDGRVENSIVPDGPNLTIFARGSGENSSETEYISAVEIVLTDE